MKAKYKLLALVPLMALIGCKEDAHKNVVTDVGNFNNDKVVSIKDIKTDIERIYMINGNPEYPYAPWADYIQIGDTITIYCDDATYQRSRILSSKKYANIYYGNDSLNIRQERDKMNKIKQKMQKTR